MSEVGFYIKAKNDDDRFEYEEKIRRADNADNAYYCLHEIQRGQMLRNILNRLVKDEGLRDEICEAWRDDLLTLYIENNVNLDNDYT